MRADCLLCLVSLALALGGGCGEVVTPGSDVGPGAGEGSGEDDEAEPTPSCADADCTCVGDDDCAPREVCDQAQGMCTCAPGYVGTEGAGCVWGGGLVDPSFQDGTAWTADRSASVSPLATGDIAPGEAFFGADAVCALGELRQRVHLPPYERAEPLVATINYRSMGNPDDLVGVALRLGGAWLALPGRPRWTTMRLCLGESAYGGAQDIQVAPARTATGCDTGQPTSMLTVDHLAITPAAPGECPKPGTVRNGDFEGEDGWTGTGLGDGVAIITEDAGLDGSRAAYLAARTQCSRASLTGQASWPMASTMPSPALDLWWEGTRKRTLELSFGDRPVAWLEGTGRERRSRICVPPWAQGLATSIVWALPEREDGCSRSDVRDFYLDDMQVVNEPGCGTDPYLLDGGFEAAAQGLENGWQRSAGRRSEVALLDEEDLAHSGAGVASLALYEGCAAAAVETAAVVPLPESGRGPALTFWYQTRKNRESELFVRAGDGPAHGPLPEDDDWRQETVCLPPALAGRPLRIGFRLDAGEQRCDDDSPTEEALIDDVALTTAPGCPTSNA